MPKVICSLGFQVIFLNLFLLICGSKDNILVSEDASEMNKVCNGSAYVFIATVDGNLVALDFDTGTKCWSIVLDLNGFMSSSLSKLEVWENDAQVWLIPSLDGTLFKFDKIKLEPLSVNVESFFNESPVFDSTSITAGKFKFIHGISRHTGEIYYKCSIDGCENFNKVFAEDTLIIEQVIQSATAVDPVTAENRWHFRVVEIHIKTLPDLSSSRNTSFKTNMFVENALMPYVNHRDFHNMHMVKISLANGYTARLNQSFQFTWLHKASSPIVDVWYNKDNRVQLLDPFYEEPGFFSIDSDDGSHVALLFLGSYMDQLFVKKSKILKTKVAHNHALSRRASYEAHSLLMDLNSEKSTPFPAQESNALTHSDKNLDHGYYFFVNFSVYDNNTHCVVDFKEKPFPDTLSKDNYWFQRGVAGLFIITLVCYFTLEAFHRKKKFASEGTSTVEFSLCTNEALMQNKEDKQDFISRFHKDFQLITILGKGGFGIVMEVKNNIDDCNYAVKRIRIRVSDEFKELGYGPVMREVKALAKLDHPGVVRYFNSWVEYPPKGWQELKDKEFDIVDVSRSTTNEDSQLKSGSDDYNEPKEVLKPIKISHKLGINPLNPFNDNFFNSGFPVQDLSKLTNDNSSRGSSSSSNSSDCLNADSKSSLLFNNSDTFSLNNTSKESISDLSLCYDYECESDFSDDVSTEKKIFYLKRRTSIKNSNNLNTLPLADHVSEFPYGDGKISDIRTMFNIPSDLFIDKEAVFLHLKKINKCLVLRMSREYLHKFYRYIFHDVSCPDPDHSEWSKWSCIFQDTENDKISVTLDQLQNWLISVLCVLRNTESHFHSLLLTNLSNILWEVNLMLERDVCLPKPPVCSSNNTYINTVDEFFHLKVKNDALAWPMKFIFLLKLRHYIFCKSNQCLQPDWKAYFYKGDISIYRKNLYLFQIWIMSILCEAKHDEFLNKHTCSKLCIILSEVDFILQEKIIITHSSSNFFSLFGNLLIQPKNTIQLEEKKDIRFIMFLNTNLPENAKHCCATNKKPHQSTNDVHGFLYIQMQLCRRDSLRNWLDMHSQHRNYAEVMNMFHQIVDAMAYVHAQGLMHRDLKPSNIYFSLEGSIKIGDFGLATQFEVQGPAEESLSTSLAGFHTRQCGTELYMSPEQRSKKSYNYKTDIFSLGIILYELLVPFGTRMERYKAIYAARDHQFSQDFIKQYSKECLLVQKLLDNEPKRRPTASEIKKHPLFVKFQHLRI